MAGEDDSRKDEVVAAELPAPAGWVKKIIPKKGGSAHRSDVVFVSPTGEEIKTKRQLDQYLKSHPGGPTASEFDWAAGDTPRRSARLSEKSKAVETSAIQSPTKRQKRSATKRGAANEKSNTNNAEGEATADRDNAADEELKENPDTEIPEANEELNENPDTEIPKADKENPDTEIPEAKELKGNPATEISEADKENPGAEIPEANKDNLDAEIPKANTELKENPDVEIPEVKNPVQGEPGVTDQTLPEKPNSEQKASETDPPAVDDAHTNANIAKGSNTTTTTDAKTNDSYNTTNIGEAEEKETTLSMQNHESEDAAHVDKETSVETREKQVDNSNGKGWLFGTGN